MESWWDETAAVAKLYVNTVELTKLEKVKFRLDVNKVMKVGGYKEGRIHANFTAFAFTIPLTFDGWWNLHIL